MKCILITILMLSTIVAEAREPKFYKGQQVKYETGFFLHKVCSGKGVIYEVNEDFVYTIQSAKGEYECPTFIEKHEGEIKSNE